MSWINKLYETYNNCQSAIGIIPKNEKEIPLLPICHTTQRAHIEITIDNAGNFRRANFVDQVTSRTIIPCSESSGGRTRGGAPHPLCDKLQYVAGDYKEFGGTKSHYYDKFVEELKSWCDSEYSHPKAAAVLEYIKKSRTVSDLVQTGIMMVNSNGELIDKWDKKKNGNAPSCRQDEVFVRWIVEEFDKPQAAVWTDNELFKSWASYYLSCKKDKNLCYVSGEEKINADQHPAKIRSDGDKAKIISSNDNEGFTFRGRFAKAEQVCSVSFEVTQKAHSALRWLIGKQGRVFYEGKPAKPGLTILAWATSDKKIPDILSDYSDLGIVITQENEHNSQYTAQELAKELNKFIAGYSVNLGKTDEIVVIGLDSATTGRMAISFYRELTGSEFLEKLEYWHNSCCWLHVYLFKEKNDKKGKWVKFAGAPSPNDIAEAAYGRRIDDKLRKATVERLLSCIVDGQKIPRDLVTNVVRRASNRIAMSDAEWNRTLSIGCALYRKYQKDYKREDYKMELEEDRCTRDYLYGELLAVAENIEQYALQKTGEKRPTNAARLMQRFAERPFSTWRNIELALTPYRAKTGKFRQGLLDSIMSRFSNEDFINDRPLSGEFLLGYHCQRAKLWLKKEQIKNESEDIENAKQQN